MSTMWVCRPLVVMWSGQSGHTWHLEPRRLLWGGGARWLRVHRKCGHHRPLLSSGSCGCPHHVLWNDRLYPLDSLWSRNRHWALDIVFGGERINTKLPKTTWFATYCWPPPDSVLEHGDIKVSHYIKRESIRTSLGQHGSYFTSTCYKVNTCPFTEDLAVLVMYRPLVETTAPLNWRICEEKANHHHR